MIGAALSTPVVGLSKPLSADFDAIADLSEHACLADSQHQCLLEGDCRKLAAEHNSRPLHRNLEVDSVIAKVVVGTKNRFDSPDHASTARIKNMCRSHRAYLRSGGIRFTDIG